MRTRQLLRKHLTGGRVLPFEFNDTEELLQALDASNQAVDKFSLD